LTVSRKPGLAYCAVTPARNEEDNLRRLAAAMLAQHVRPVAWVIVENGSVDGTLDIARELERAHPWVRVLRTQPSDGYDRTSAYMNAFHGGVDALDGAGDVVVKLDADVSFEADYFARLVEAFEQDPRLGIASGTLFEERGGTWREIVLLGDHCWGPTRAYRRSCLHVVLPLDDSIGYSVIDETRAHLAGFRTGTLRQLPFRHHRPEGAREGGGWREWSRQGSAAHYTGYRFSYCLARASYRALSDPAALALPAGYVLSRARRRPTYGERSVVDAVREQQRMRHILTTVGTRLRERVTAVARSLPPRRTSMGRWDQPFR
jgi:glycosyltransferase involved in cell wall biosynthesis